MLRIHILYHYDRQGKLWKESTSLDFKPSISMIIFLLSHLFYLHSVILLTTAQSSVGQTRPLRWHSFEIEQKSCP